MCPHGMALWHHGLMSLECPQVNPSETLKITFFNLATLNLDLYTHRRECQGQSLDQILGHYVKRFGCDSANRQTDTQTLGCWRGRKKSQLLACKRVFLHPGKWVQNWARPVSLEDSKTLAWLTHCCPMCHPWFVFVLDQHWPCYIVPTWLLKCCKQTFDKRLRT